MAGRPRARRRLLDEVEARGIRIAQIPHVSAYAGTRRRRECGDDPAIRPGNPECHIARALRRPRAHVEVDICPVVRIGGAVRGVVRLPTCVIQPVTKLDRGTGLEQVKGLTGHLPAELLERTQVIQNEQPRPWDAITRSCCPSENFTSLTG